MEVFPGEELSDMWLMRVPPSSGLCEEDMAEASPGSTHGSPAQGLHGGGSKTRGPLGLPDTPSESGRLYTLGQGQWRAVRAAL